jgi:hypothetical protein
MRIEVKKNSVSFMKHNSETDPNRYNPESRHIGRLALWGTGAYQASAET